VVRYAVADGGAAAGDADLVATDVVSDAQGTRFDLHVAGEPTRSVAMPMHGRFNVENVLAALGATRALGVPLEESIAALPGFRGVKRRQEVRGEVRGVAVIDDFAHHPTAVQGCIEALRARYPERRLVAVFEPRTNTSRRRIFQDAYAKASSSRCPTSRSTARRARSRISSPRPSWWRACRTRDTRRSRSIASRRSSPSWPRPVARATWCSS
jgi:UDP-N-acetylmuramate: L-alanyl-gamma-D-glutamyl-meso-diaminopimelate ligase